MLKRYINSKLRFWYLVTLVVIAGVGMMLRSFYLTAPVADWHSWRQADTAAVARNFGKFGFDTLRPRFDDLSNIPSGKDNLQGWRMVEFPLYQAVAFLGKEIISPLPIEVWLRLVTIVASAVTGLLIGIIVIQFDGVVVGFFAALLFAVLPYNVYYGRTILPDPFMVFWSVLSLLFLSRVAEFSSNIPHQIKRPRIIVWIMVLGAAGAAALALLVKPTAIFLLFPSVYLLYRVFGFSQRLLIGLFVYSFICLFPLWAWRQWIIQFPEGIPVYTWLLNEGGIRFKGAWFWWLFAERLGKLILGYWGLIPLGLGLLVRPARSEGWFFRWWAVGALLYLIVVARGNVQHDYYQIIILPLITVYLAKGFAFLLSNQVFPKAISYQLSAISFLFMLAFSWYTVRTYYWINRPEIVEAGRMADQLLPPDAKVIAPYNGDTTFLYQINRRGWPIGFDIDKKIGMGATHYVTVSPTDNDLETRELAEKYTVLVRNDKFAIIDLTKLRMQ